MSDEARVSFATPTGQVDGEVRPAAKRRRIAVACGNCRARKSKCDGARPTCQSCRNQDLACVYASSGPLSSSAGKDSYLPRIAHVERILQDLTRRVENIQRHLSLPPQTPLMPEGDDGGGLHQDPSDGIGSIAFHNEQEAGFFGPSSNIAFTRCTVRAITAVLNRRQRPGAHATSESNLVRPVPLVSRPPSPATQSIGLPAVTIEAQSPFCVPRQEETSSLIDRYFESTGALFPFIHKETFMQKYHHSRSTNFTSVHRTWLGLLYMVMAMASSTALDNTPDEGQRSTDSDIFYQRARAVCERNVRIGNSLENVQLLLLMSQYLQGTSRSIETWGVHGLAIKAAYQLGIHSKQALQPCSPLEREFRTRTWFGCVLLDRSLSMTLGRPSMIPESHVKLEMPRKLLNEDTTPRDSTLFSQASSNHEDVEFFTRTISLYRLLHEILTILYGDNLGCEYPPGVYDVVSQALQLEHKLLAWQSGLPPILKPVTQDDILRHRSEEAVISKFQVVLTLRYLNIRILVHRPVLEEFLSEIERADLDGRRQDSVLRAIGFNSLSACMQSAIDVINVIAAIVCVDNGPRYLLGAWWFSSFYVFNAALVIFSGLLVQLEGHEGQDKFRREYQAERRSALLRAVECLKRLDKGNGVAQKCAEYLSALIHILETLYPHDDEQSRLDGHLSAEAMAHFSGGHQFSDAVYNETDLLSMDLTHLMDPAILDFWNADFSF